MTKDTAARRDRDYLDDALARLGIERRSWRSEFKRSVSLRRVLRKLVPLAAIAVFGWLTVPQQEPDTVHSVVATLRSFTDKTIAR